MWMQDGVNSYAPGDIKWENITVPTTESSILQALNTMQLLLLLLLFSHYVMSNSATPWTVAHQVSLPIGFPRQEY